MTFCGGGGGGGGKEEGTEHFSEKNGALRWSILVGTQKHHVQKPKPNTVNVHDHRASIFSKDHRAFKRK